MGDWFWRDRLNVLLPHGAVISKDADEWDVPRTLLIGSVQTLSKGN